MRACIVLLGLMAWIPMGSHAESIDRREMAVAAYRIFPILLKVAAAKPEITGLSEKKREIYNKVLEIGKSAAIPLVFSSRSEDFIVNSGETERLMRTPINAPGEVEVNLKLLNSPVTQVTLPLLLKIFFHEWAQKIGEPDMALRDSVAQAFESAVAPYVRPISLEGGKKLTLLSVPLADLNDEVAPTSINRPLPTNVVLIESEGVVQDVTEVMLVALEQPSSVIRSIWTEANRAIFEIFKQMGEMVKKSVGPALAQFQAALKGLGVNPISDEDIQKTFGFSLKEIRVLELQDAQSVETPRGTYVRFKANYTYSRTMRGNVNINANGFPFQNKMPVALTLTLQMPSKGSVQTKDFFAGLRPDTNLMDMASVRSVHRSSDGFVEQLVVDFPGGVRPEMLYLAASSDNGTRYIPSQAIEARANGTWRAHFAPSRRFLGLSEIHVAESLLVGSDKTIFLDRLVSLNADRMEPMVKAEPNDLVPDSLGIWGLKGGQPQFIKQFRFQEPALFIDNLDSPHLSLNPSALDIEFDLVHEEKVREIHLHLKRTLTLVDVTQNEEDKKAGKEPPRVAETKWGGRMVRVSNGGALLKTREVREILVAEGPTIFRTETAAGTQHVRARLQAPYISIEPDPSYGGNQVQALTLATPVLVEITLESGRVLRKAFGEALPESFCEMHLKANQMQQAQQ